jgi:hypothetical protein
VKNQLGGNIVDLSKIGLTQGQVDAASPWLKNQPFSTGRRQKSIIGAPRSGSIIGR